MSKVKSIEVDGYHFYKVTDIFPKTFLKKLYKSSTYWLEKTRKDTTEEVFPPEASGRLFEYEEFKNDPIWIRYYNTLDDIVKEYSKLVDIPMDYLSRHASWITRVKDLNFPHKMEIDLVDRLRRHSTEGNMHAHLDCDPVTSVFYLKNPDKKYGTLIKKAGGSNMLNFGEENSIIIFDGRLFHSAVYPPMTITKKYPRYTIIADYEFKYSMHVRGESFKRSKPAA